MAFSTFTYRFAILLVGSSISVSVLAASSAKQGMYGSPASASNIQRTINLNKNYVNVVQGETVRFVTPNGDAFIWTFDTWTTNTFKLANIAPENIRVGNATVFVQPNPLYLGGSQ
ncbi:CzcE family metal-binding protein [Noviherbaspirillum sp. CPCC 100848]|uniref:CzcE family metal-binding protein n=1 Tax=Noviherbaspirillum album TaxID=3080276 RepID=A0ABU6J4A4_9BURK|nr:CzcE family metal-binding protein [Noviherbaspirillum sp. CPCC 100848]MEC4718444.1 CzcE family metal-binding protein [Noviherbaspirillum sp. CPCC 100848]